MCIKEMKSSRRPCFSYFSYHCSQFYMFSSFSYLSLLRIFHTFPKGRGGWGMAQLLGRMRKTRTSLRPAPISGHKSHGPKPQKSSTAAEPLLQNPLRNSQTMEHQHSLAHSSSAPSSTPREASQAISRERWVNQKMKQTIETYAKENTR